MAAECEQCGKKHLPPRPICDNCLSENFRWIKLSKKGKLLTYTTIYVAPHQFKDLAPYSVGIVQFEKDLKIPGMIIGIPEDKIRIGMTLFIHFDSIGSQETWHEWPRYYFKES